MKRLRHVCGEVIQKSVICLVSPLHSGAEMALPQLDSDITNWTCWYWCKDVSKYYMSILQSWCFEGKVASHLWDILCLLAVLLVITFPVLPLALMKGTQYGSSEWMGNAPYNNTVDCKPQVPLLLNCLLEAWALQQLEDDKRRKNNNIMQHLGHKMSLFQMYTAVCGQHRATLEGSPI